MKKYIGSDNTNVFALFNERFGFTIKEVSQLTLEEQVLLLEYAFRHK